MNFFHRPKEELLSCTSCVLLDLKTVLLTAYILIYYIISKTVKPTIISFDINRKYVGVILKIYAHLYLRATLIM